MPVCQSPFSRRAILPGNAVSRCGVSDRGATVVLLGTAFPATPSLSSPPAVTEIVLAVASDGRQFARPSNTGRFAEETITGHQAVRLEPGNRLGKPQCSGTYPLHVRYG
jgi:hypothetical protein